MYPNLYYLFKDLFGVEWAALKVLNMFGLMVALSFVAAGIVFSSELRRKEKLGLLLPREEEITVGRPASIFELVFNGIVGFFFGYKILGLLFARPDDVNPQDYIFSSAGSILGGLVLAAVLAAMKFYDRKKHQLKIPETRKVRIWPHDRVGDIIILALVFGILGSKLFDSLEHWDKFIADPIKSLLSPSGLAFYGGLIMATIAIVWFAYRKGIKIKHLVDSAAPAIMIAYAVGRIGCQVAGDGDWGVFNSAYVSDEMGNVTLAEGEDFKNSLQKNAPYFTDGTAINEAGVPAGVTDRTYGTLENVPSRYWKGPSFLPNWMFAYSFPQNVNGDGMIMPGITDEHNRVLPQPVIPTSLYETIICGLMFLLMWLLRKKITIPWLMFGFYLVLNGLERFFIETVRVNKVYDAGGFNLSQAEIIALWLIFAGIALSAFAFIRRKQLVQ